MHKPESYTEKEYKVINLNKLNNRLHSRHQIWNVQKIGIHIMSDGKAKNLKLKEDMKHPIKTRISACLVKLIVIPMVTVICYQQVLKI